jgi:uncharacterized protein (DUF1330 family)
MPAYGVALVTINDPAKYQEYQKLAGPAATKYGGKVVAKGVVESVIEGKGPHQRVMVVEFATVEAAKAFYASPEYVAAREKRIGASDFNMLIVDGS